MKAFRRVLASMAGLGLATAIGLAAQTPSGPDAPLQFKDSDRIPFDDAVRRGTLPNGLQYFVRQNANPDNRVMLRLAVKAGSLDEEDDQQGLAHFIEHMAFNGTTHFKPGELVSYFESTGTRLGPHVNAYTSFEETVYMLELPTDQPEILAKGLTALADFAGGLTLDPEQVDRERGVVIEEWRGRLGAGSRISDKQIPFLYYQSRYAARLPIGKPDVIKGAPVARLRAFYDTWYRPDRMAIVVVGDVNPDEIVESIRTTFGPVSARAPAKERVDATIPLHEDQLVSIATDPELTQSSVQVVRKRPAEGQDLVGDYRRSLVLGLFSRMFNERLGELARKPDAAFLSAGVGGGSLGRTVDTFSLSARVADGTLPAGLRALMVEAKRISEFGFYGSELDRAKRSMLSSYDRAFNERDKTDSSSYAREYVSHFTTGEPSPGIAYEYALVKEALPQITLDEVTTLGRTLLETGSQVLLAVAPDRPDLTAPTADEFRATLASIASTEVTPWSESATALTLMEETPDPGAIESQRELPGLGITIVRFANGVEAWLKPTDFKNDQIVFTMLSPGGASLAEPSNFINASLAPSFVGLSGAGGLKAVELQRLLAGKSASASPFIALSTHGISGSAAPAEIETALQLLYQEFTAPGDDPEAFALLKRQFGAMVANRGQNPGQVFNERLAEINASGHYTSLPYTNDDLEVLDPQRMLAFYRERFANAADFTFFMVGTFELRTVIPLLAEYVGSLPSTGKRTARVTDLNIQFPQGVTREVVRKGLEPRANTVISFFADPSWEAAEQERIGAALTVLEITMRDVLREELGQTYTVSVGLAQPIPQRGAGHVQVRFGAAPENIETLTNRVFAEVKRLQEEGPSDDLTARAKETARRAYETSLKQNAYWLRRMQTINLLNGDPQEIVTRDARIQALTPAAIRDAFNRYFPLDRYTILTLLPESAPVPQ